MKKFFIHLAVVLMGLCLVCTASSAQSFTVSGKVIEAGSGEPVIGATVMVKGTTNGVVADIDGSYSITAKAGDVLQCLCIGYAAQEATVQAGGGNIDFLLDIDSQMLEETVVVGYGTLKKSQLVGSVENVSGEVLEDRANADLTRSLQGQVPGLNIIQTDGKPTHGGQVYIRGGATSYVAQGGGNTKTAYSIGQEGAALVLIDGVEGELSSVNPDDVESISVLKDASSSVVYGARAAYGVILVTTKNSKDEKISVNYNGSVSFNQRTVMWEDNIITDGLAYLETFYDFYRGHDATIYKPEGNSPTNINQYNIPSDYLERYRAWQASGEGPKIEKPGEGGNTSSSYLYYGYNENWIEKFYKRMNVSHNHNLSISGKAQRVTYSLSGRFNGQDGIYKIGNEDFSTYNLRSKISIKVTDQITIDNNTSYASTSYTQPIFGRKVNEVGSQLWQIGVAGFPIIPVTNEEDGSYTIAAAQSGYSAFNDGNSAQEDTKSTFMTTLGATYEPFKDVFKIRADFSFKNINRRLERYIAPVQYSTAPGTLKDDVPKQDSYKQGYNYRTNYITANVVGTYTPKLGDNHNLNLVAGWNIENYDYNRSGTLRKSMYYPDKPNFELMDGTEIQLDQDGSSYGLVGFFARANYTLMSRYIFELSARYDGSSKFPAKQQWGFFPSASFGWRISEEKWMESTRSWLNNLKLRANAGSLGNGTVAPYSFLTTMGISKTGAIFDGEFVNKVSDPAVVPDNLSWETVTTYDVGLDFDVLNSRLSFAGDYYIRNTTDLYIPGPDIPAIFGENTPKGNYGALQTRGWELTLSWRDAVRLGNHDLTYSIKGSLWDSRTWVTKYTNENPVIWDLYEGKELGELWGFRTDGYFLSNEEAENWYPDTYHWDSLRDRYYAGDLKFLDLDGNQVIDSGSRTINDYGDLERVGNVMPRFSYGLNLDLRWNGIGLSMFFQGVGKRDWYPSRGSDFFWGGYARPYTWALKDQAGDNYVHIDKSDPDNWVVSNADKNPYWTRRSYEKADRGHGSMSFCNDYYLQNAAYIRLKNLTIDYSLPSKLLEKAKIEKLRIYFSGENLLTWSPMFRHTSMFDPEVIGNGDSDFHDGTSNTMGDGYSYPMMRTFTIGINLTF